jgi:hypothetical protein
MTVVILVGSRANVIRYIREESANHKNMALDGHRSRYCNVIKYNSTN